VQQKVLEMRNIDKSFSGTHALRESILTSNREKSTRCSVKWCRQVYFDQSIGGIHHPDSGQIIIDVES
jgi:hypothetical protein